MTENYEIIEQQLRDSAALLPANLRDRVLDACAAKAHERKRRERRANWRLAWGFAVVGAIHFVVGGTLNAQQQNLMGNPPASTRYANAASEKELRESNQFRAQLMADLNAPRLNDPRHSFY